MSDPGAAREQSRVKAFGQVVLAVAVVLCCTLCVCAGVVPAHPGVSTGAMLKIDGEGVVTLTVVHDGLAFAIGDRSLNVADAQMHDLLKGPTEALVAALDDGRARFLISMQMHADGVLLPMELLRSPGLESVREWMSEHPDLTLPCKQQFVARAKLPAGARALRVRFPEICADVVVVVDRDGVEPVTLPLRAAEESPEIDVTMIGVRPVPASAAAQAAPHGAVVPTDQSGALSTAWRYARFGFLHIIPSGPDHCLFVLGLFLLSPKIKPVLYQITAFTIAHTVTLTLATLHLVSIPESIVEPTIALSIAFVGIENLLTKKVHPWRPLVAFLFGLIHGMGVATAFSEVPYPEGQLVPSLAAFTVGVEGGHFAVLAAAAILLGWCAGKSWYRERVAVPLSLVIAAIALYWAVERVFMKG